MREEIIREDIIKALENIRPEVDFENEDNFVDQGLLDSFDLVSILDEFSETFDIELGFDALEKKNFNTLQGMIDMVNNATTR